MTAQSIRRDFSVEDVAVVDLRGTRIRALSLEIDEIVQKTHVASAYDRVRDDIPPCATARDISAVQPVTYRSAFEVYRMKEPLTCEQEQTRSRRQ